MKVGVLAVQGNFREHAAMLRRLGADVVEDEPLRGVFIRAPRVREAGLDVEVLAELHPELTDDTRVHERFLERVRKIASWRGAGSAGAACRREETNVRA